MIQQTSGEPGLQAGAAHRLRELLLRWLRMEREVIPHEEFAQLVEDTRRELGQAFER